MVEPQSRYRVTALNFEAATSRSVASKELISMLWSIPAN